MKPILVAYGTTEGQTRKVAEYIGAALRAGGAEAAIVDSADVTAMQVQPIYAAAIVCGSLHQHVYQSSLLQFVRDNRAWLAGIPTAFVSVSLTAAVMDEDSEEELLSNAEEFCNEAGWSPGVTLHVAGALRYSQYDYLKRLIMKMIARKHGADIDTSVDHEYTDWETLTAFVQDFLAGTASGKPHLQQFATNHGSETRSHSSAAE